MNDRWRVLALTRYGSRGASSRLRFLQYGPYLERAGASVTVSPFLNDETFDRFVVKKERHISDILPAYARRLRAVLTVRRYSLVWVEKEVFPFLPCDLYSLLSASGVPYVVDYDDAIFHTYDRHRSRWVRRLLGQKLNGLLRSARHVTVGNTYLQQYVESHGARSVTQIPTVVDAARYTVSPQPTADELRIGWIGSAATSMYLDVVKDALVSLSRKQRIKLVTIGAPPLRGFDVPLEQHPWTEESENALLGSVHLGIMPLRDGEWERGKCGYKLIQYMAAGRPVVASPVGINREIVTRDVGYLPSKDSEWVEAISALANDRNKRIAYGVAARRLVESKYSLQVTAPLFVSQLRKAANV